MASSVMQELLARPDLDAPPLSKIIEIVEHAPSAEQRAGLLALALERFKSSASPAQESLYITLAFRLKSGGRNTVINAKDRRLGSPTTDPAGPKCTARYFWRKIFRSAICSGTFPSSLGAPRTPIVPYHKD